MAYRLIDVGSNYNFLARPRRFGKSLFVDTLSELFRGSKDLFEGLFIYDKWDWNEKSIKRKIDYVLELNCKNYEVEISECYSEDSGIYLER